MVVDEAVSSAVAGADVLDVLEISQLPLGVHRPPHSCWSRKFGGHLGAEAEQTEALVEHERAVDGEVREHPALLEDGLLAVPRSAAFELDAKVGPAYRVFRGRCCYRLRDLKQQCSVAASWFVTSERIFEA